MVWPAQHVVYLQRRLCRLVLMVELSAIFESRAVQRFLNLQDSSCKRTSTMQKGWKHLEAPSFWIWAIASESWCGLTSTCRSTKFSQRKWLCSLSVSLGIPQDFWGCFANRRERHVAMLLWYTAAIELSRVLDVFLVPIYVPIKQQLNINNHAALASSRKWLCSSTRPRPAMHVNFEDLFDMQSYTMCR